VKPSFTVVTYNLWGYHTPAEYLRKRGEVRGAMPDSRAATAGPPDSVWGKRRALLVKTLQEADPDLIAFQENVRRPGTPERSHAQQLGRSLGMTVVEGAFTPGTDAHGQAYGNGVALLSHLPVEEVKEAPLPYDNSVEIGGTPSVLQVTLDFEGEPLHLWVAHLPAKSEPAREQGAAAIRDYATETQFNAPLILCGDFNSEPETPPHRILCGSEDAPFTDCWAALHPKDAGWTMFTPAPARRLDYLLLHNPARILSPRDIEVMGNEPDAEGFFPSDHCGVKAVFERNGE
jgi:endonuclease/exonuclease/phosphatase family metal-dependent hydrolase